MVENDVLRFDLPTTSATSGNPFTGSILLLLSNDVQCNTLTLKLKGKVFVEWNERYDHFNGTETQSEVATYTRKEDLCDKHFPLYTFQSSEAAAGAYRFPFSISIPSRTPATFAKGARMMKAWVTYNLSAKLDSKKAPKPAKVDIYVSKPHKDTSNPVDANAVAKLRNCCFSKGDVRMSVHISKGGFPIGDTAEIAVDIDNSRSSIGVSQVKARLKRLIRLWAETDDGLRNYVVRTTLKEVVVEAGVDAGQKKDGVVVMLPISGDEEGEERVATVNEASVECEYSISTRCVMSGGKNCCSQTAKVTRSVVVFLRPQGPIDGTEGISDKNWVVMPIAVFQDDERYDHLRGSLPQY